MHIAIEWYHVKFFEWKNKHRMNWNEQYKTKCKINEQDVLHSKNNESLHFQHKWLTQIIINILNACNYKQLHVFTMMLTSKIYWSIFKTPTARYFLIRFCELRKNINKFYEYSLSIPSVVCQTILIKLKSNFR